MHAHALLHKDTQPCDLLLWIALASPSVCKQSCPRSLRLASPLLISASTHWLLQLPQTQEQQPILKTAKVSENTIIFFRLIPNCFIAQISF